MFCMRAPYQVTSVKSPSDFRLTLLNGSAILHQDEVKVARNCA